MESLCGTCLLKDLISDFADGKMIFPSASGPFSIKIAFGYGVLNKDTFRLEEVNKNNIVLLNDDFKIEIARDTPDDVFMDVFKSKVYGTGKSFKVNCLSHVDIVLEGPINDFNGQKVIKKQCILSDVFAFKNLLKIIGDFMNYSKMYGSQIKVQKIAK
jgi:hypothetical protein